MIFCVEDDSNIRELVVYTLESTGFQARGFEDGSSFLEALALETPELVLLDIMLPGEDGMELLRKLKASKKTREIPVIMVTAKGAEYDKVKGLDAGADDYVTKPFRPLEVVARVKAQLRRYKKYSPATNAEKIQPELSYSKLRLNTQTHECLLEGEAISLTPTEFSILHVLLANAGNVVSIEDLFHVVWKDEYYSKNSSTITVHIRHLREKLKDTSDNPQYIKTIWGVGYKI